MSSEPGLLQCHGQDVRDAHFLKDSAIVIFNGIRKSMFDDHIPLEGGTSEEEEQESLIVEYGSDIFPDGSGLVLEQIATITTWAPRSPFATLSRWVILS